MKFNATAGNGFVQVEAETIESAAEAAEPKLREIIAGHLDPNDADYPIDMVVTSGDGTEKTFAFVN